MKVLIALDLDGTCLDQRGNSSPELIKCIESQQKVVLIYVTGRTITSALKVIRGASLPEPDYLVSDVGNRVFQRQGDCYCEDSVYKNFNRRMWFITTNGKISPIDLCVDSRIQSGDMVRRFSYWADSFESADRTARSVSFYEHSDRIGTVRYDGPVEGRWWIDVLPCCAGKGTAVHYIAFIEGISLESVLAVGDSLNDVDMLYSDFLAAVPANASPRLLEALNCVGNDIYFSRESAPNGTVDAIRTLLVQIGKKKSHNSEIVSSRKKLLLDCLRKSKILSIGIKTLDIWPDRLRNWGIVEPHRCQGPIQSTVDHVMETLDRRQNWWWETSSPPEKNAILDRFRAIPVKFLLEQLNVYINRFAKGARLLGGMVSGSYLYAPLEETANDLDLVLILDGLNRPALGIEIEVPGLRTNFPTSYAHRLNFDRVGLGLLDISSLNGLESSPEALQMTASMQGSGLPLFGCAILNLPMPAFDLLCQATKLINDVFHEPQNHYRDPKRRYMLRCAEANRVVMLAAKQLMIEYTPYDKAVKLIENECAIRKHVRENRRGIAKVFFNLVEQVMKTYAMSELKEISRC